MPTISLTRRYRFSSSHRLHSPMLSDAVNRAVYGKCNNPHGHGHDYILDVSVAGEPDPVTGRLLPLAHLDELVRRVILAPMDRRDLNSEIDEFAGLVPTTENLAIVVARRLESAWARALPGAAARLDKIRIHETKNNIFQIRVSDPAPSLPPGAEAANEESPDGPVGTTKSDENTPLARGAANGESGSRGGDFRLSGSGPAFSKQQSANDESGSKLTFVNEQSLGSK